MGLYQNVAESTAGNAQVNLFDGAGNALTSTTGWLNVNISGGSISTGVADETAFTYGTSLFQPVGGFYNTSITNLTSGQSGAASLTQARGLHVNLRSPAGVEYIGQAAMAASIPVVIASNQSVISITQNSLGTVSPGTAGTQSSLAGFVYTSGGITLTTGQQAALQATSAGALITSDVNTLSLNAKASPGTATLTQVAYSASSVSLLSSNAARKGVLIANGTGKSAYLAFAATATSTAYTLLLQANGVYECNLGTYTGAISALWSASTSGNIYVTELT